MCFYPKISRFHSPWRSFGAVQSTKKPVSKVFQSIAKKKDGAKITFFFYIKKILSLQHQTITYEPTLYIFHFTLVPPPCGVSHLLRKRTRCRNRLKLLWLTILFLRFEHLVQRRPDGFEISVNFTVRLL